MYIDKIRLQKKGINIFFKKGVFKGGGTMLPRGGQQMLSYAPVLRKISGPTQPG